NGNLVSAGGMALAVGATALIIAVNSTVSGAGWLIIVAGILVGGGLGLYTARTVKMTAMPQLVSLFNAVGGGAAALIAIDDYIRLASAQTFAAGHAIPLEVSIPTVLDVVIDNPVLIIAGALVVASGAILTKFMADAMNRSVVNIMVGGFGCGEGTVGAAAGPGGEVRGIGVDDAAIQLAYAQNVIVVPGYG